MDVRDSYLYSKQDIYRLEQLAYQKQGWEPMELMERAGQAAWDVLRQQWPDARRIIVLCGLGNNAGDGYVVARLAQLAGCDVRVFVVEEDKDAEELTQHMAQSCTESGISLQSSAQLDNSLDCDLIVDALIGIGLSRLVEGEYRRVIECLNLIASPILSLDCPSGIDADTGCVWGEAVHAAATVTFIARKQGLYSAQAPAHTGHIFLASLDLPVELFEEVSTPIRRIYGKYVRQKLPRRRRDSHKGNFGHVLVVGGDYGMGGAVLLAAEGALRVGAGLVTVATRPEHVHLVSGARPEIMSHQVTVTTDLLPLMEKATVVVMGPGLGQSSWSQELFACLVESELPLLLDADALNLLAKNPRKHNNWVLTPHPGEASRLLSCAVADVQSNRFSSVQELRQRYGGVVLLKGAGSVIRGDDDNIYLCAAGNPGMASGGMGDILSGMIGGLIAQGLSLSTAAQTGVWIHARAGDLAAEKGGERGLLASDVMSFLRRLVNPSSHPEWYDD